MRIQESIMAALYSDSGIEQTPVKPVLNSFGGGFYTVEGEGIHMHHIATGFKAHFSRETHHSCHSGGSCHCGGTCHK